jgi:hypothetical protein
MLETNWQHWIITMTREENKQPQLMINQGIVIEKYPKAIYYYTNNECL